MKNKIEVPRHPELGITVTIIVDPGEAGSDFVMKQEIISNSMLKRVHFFDEILMEYLKKNSYEIVEYMKKEGFIKQEN